MNTIYSRKRALIFVENNEISYPQDSQLQITDVLITMFGNVWVMFSEDQKEERLNDSDLRYEMLINENVPFLEPFKRYY